MGRSTTSSRAATSQHSRYGEQFEAIVHAELRRRLVPPPAAMQQSRPLTDPNMIERTRALMACADGFEALADSYTAMWRSQTRGGGGAGPRALQFDQLEADVWADVAEGAAEPLLSGVSDALFSSVRLGGAGHGSGARPHGAGVMVVEATTCGAATLMRLKLLKLERVLAYAEAERGGAVCAFMAVQQPDQAAAAALSSFIADHQVAMPRVWALSSAGNLGFVSVPGEMMGWRRADEVVGSGLDLPRCTPPVCAVHGAEYILQLRAELDSMAEQLQRLGIVQEQAELERAADRERLAEAERARAADGERMDQLAIALAGLQAAVASSNADVASLRAALGHP